MKQRHSFTNLLYHVVMPTKNREHLINTPEQERAIREYLQFKLHELDAWLEEFGSWHDHVHLLVRSGPTLALSQVYGQCKGFAAWSWKKRWPGAPFTWADGVFAATVSPENCHALRHYIRNQRKHHHTGTALPIWEGTDEVPPQPAGLDRRSS